MKKRGFTLIELLIVIAIIAILALIAVPNFIEAQTRAKVSRVMSDMRSVGTAIEAYSVDWSRYPMYYHPLDFNNGTDTTDDDSEWLTYCPINLTTPLSYMTGLTVDPFRTAAVGNDPRRPYIYRHAHDQGTAYFLDYDHSDDSFDTTSMRNSETEVNAFYAIETYFKGRDVGDVIGRSGNMYFLHSPGPDLLPAGWTKISSPVATPDATDLSREYDPTNGTVSEGDIMRWGPGGIGK